MTSEPFVLPETLSKAILVSGMIGGLNKVLSGPWTQGIPIRTLAQNIYFVPFPVAVNAYLSLYEASLAK